MTIASRGPHIDGIGGVFLYANRSARLAAWYRRVLGVPLKSLGDGIYYVEIYDRSGRNPRKRVHLVFAIFRAPRRLPARREQAMVNFRVDDLEGYVRRLKRHRVRVDPIAEGPDAEGIGKFTHLTDPEGNRLELWEPSTGV